MSVFPRGVKLEQNKAAPLKQGIEELHPSARLLVPLVGCAMQEDRLIKERAHVQCGTALSSPQHGVPAIAPVSGTVAGFCELEHPMLGSVTCAVLDVDDKQPEKSAQRKKKESSSGIIEAAGAAGILDEFDGIPLYKKLKSIRRIKKDVLVCCAADDDPYTAASAAALRENVTEALDGLALAAKFCGMEDTRLLLENGYEEELLRKEDAKIEIFLAGPRYPARGLLKRKLYTHGQKSGFLGVQACIALSRAVRKGEQHITTVVTVTGDCVTTPRNLRVLVGTPLRDLLEYCGLEQTPAAVVLGSTITGRQTTDMEMPVTANMRCIIAVRKVPRRRQFACIGCGRCVSACPRGIMPWSIREQLSHDQVNLMKLTNVQNCIACGACSMACPSGIDLTELILRASSMKKSGDFT